ncbi:MAG: class II fructose-bisphosphatase [Candidatus Latescibacterota bacterium]|nr:MAG: class II fructose-bisphosphatase [Candidatus Latescibacterota bacterium]
MDRNLALELARVTEAAALSAARWMGKGDAIQTDAAAFEAMRKALQGVQMRACVSVGRAALSGDDAFTDGMEIGNETEGSLVDLALDPLECIDSVATGRANAMSVVAVNSENSFLRAGGLYMDKIAVGPDAAGKINVNASTLENLVNVASAKRCYVEDLTVAILERERHASLIRQVREAGARIHLIPDGDLASAVATAIGDSGVDILMGIGSAQAAVLAAAALSCVGGDMHCRLAAVNPGDEERIEAITGGDVLKTYDIGGLVGDGSVMFAATGITEGDVLKGVHFRKGGATTHSVVMRRRSGTIRFIHATHFFERKPRY